MKKKKNKVNAKKIWLIVILISIILVPAFYGFTYLKSYWNNSVTINKVPIAVVDEDIPYNKDGKTFNIGETLVNNLKSNTSLDWKFVNYNEGEKGLYGDKYYAMIVIPKDFSKEIANATEDGFKKPKIDFYQNQGKNFIFSEISGIGVSEVSNTVAKSISKNVSNVLVQTIYKTKDGFKSATEGSSKLQSGIGELLNGSNALGSGVSKLLDGSKTLGNGINKLKVGSNAVTEGTEKLLNGGKTLASGESALEAGSKNLVKGENSLSNGSSALVDGMEKVQSGSTGLVSGISALEDGSSKLTSGASSLNSGMSTLAEGMKGLSKGANEISTGQKGISEEMQALSVLIQKGNTKEATTLLEKIEGQNEKLNEGINNLNGGINSALNGSNRLKSGLTVLAGGMENLNSGIVQAKNGAIELNGGISKAFNGAKSLNGGINETRNGAVELNGGISKASDGASALTDGLLKDYKGDKALGAGLNLASNGTSQLSSGLSSASNGVIKLNDGLTSANNGAKELNSGLSKGYNTLNDNVTFTAQEMSEFISNPIVLNTIAINKVSSYGEGFAPYFMCIALWIGAMYVYFMSSALSRKFEGSFKKRFLKMYLIGVVLCILQALVMSAAVYFGLGIKTSTPIWFFFINVLTIIAIYSLMNGLHYIITSIMKGALVVLMVLQFTACGGSYPVLVMPTFYNVIHPFLVLTYGVDTMRMATAGINNSIFYHDIGILVLFIVLSVVIGFLVGYLRNHITHKRALKERSELIDEEETFNQYV